MAEFLRPDCSFLVRNEKYGPISTPRRDLSEFGWSECRSKATWFVTIPGVCDFEPVCESCAADTWRVGYQDVVSVEIFSYHGCRVLSPQIWDLPRSTLEIETYLNENKVYVIKF